MRLYKKPIFSRALREKGNNKTLMISTVETLAKKKKTLHFGVNYLQIHLS